jgi:hypothetical protein
MKLTQAVESLKAQPLTPVEIPRLDEFSYRNGRLCWREQDLDVSGSQILLSFLNISKSATRAMTSTEQENLINSRISDRGDIPVVLTRQGNSIIGMRAASAPYVSNLDVLLNSGLPDTIDVKIDGTALTVRVATQRAFDAQVGDPVQVGYTISNDESGRRPSFGFATNILRLACTNGATMESSLFSEQYHGKDVGEIDMRIADFVNGLDKSMSLLSGAVQRMTGAMLGPRNYKKLRSRHERLLGTQHHDPYYAHSNYWTYWNSVTESAKRSVNREKLESMAGCLIEGFVNA